MGGGGLGGAQRASFLLPLPNQAQEGKKQPRLNTLGLRSHKLLTYSFKDLLVASFFYALFISLPDSRRLGCSVLRQEYQHNSPT